MAHWGDWAVQQFNFRVIGEVNKVHQLENIFGDLVMKPRERADLGGYNTDPTAGEIVGFLCLVDLSQRVTFSVSNLFNLNARWETVMEGEGQGGAILNSYTDCSRDYDPDGPKFPIKGLRVAVFWQEYQEWYTAKVKRWSNEKHAWVLAYDVLKDTVYEDVPVWKWKF